MTRPALDVKTFAQAAADLKGVLDAGGGVETEWNGDRYVEIARHPS